MFVTKGVRFIPFPGVGRGNLTPLGLPQQVVQTTHLTFLDHVFSAYIQAPV
jgi:hypothetical protein